MAEPPFTYTVRAGGGVTAGLTWDRARPIAMQLAIVRCLPVVVTRDDDGREVIRYTDSHKVGVLGPGATPFWEGEQ